MFFIIRYPETVIVRLLKCSSIFITGNPIFRISTTFSEWENNMDDKSYITEISRIMYWYGVKNNVGENSTRYAPI